MPRLSSDAVAKADPRKLRFYYRLILSYGDFKHAYRCAQYLMAEHESFAKSGGDDLLLKALYCSMVVSYARPFNSTGVSRIGRIPPLSTEIDSLYSEEEIEVHRYVLRCRNKLLAHSDAEVIDPDPFVATDLPNNFVIPETNDALAPFTQEYTAKVLCISEKAYHWSVEERLRLEPGIKHLLSRKAFLLDPNAKREGA